MKTNTAVKNRILELCEQKKLTINKLSVISGVSPSSIKNILYGKSNNTGIVTIKLLCDGLGISLAEFFRCSPFTTTELEEID